MSIRLQDVLNHPTLAAADPVVRAAAGRAARTQLRWVHSSEILDIAPLLDGGELLLTGGEALALASEDRRVTYIHQLAERGVAALAIETGVALPSLPSLMVSAAEAAGLPLIELRKVVPFVSVMQAINSSLVSESVSQLRRADEASHAMAVELAHGGSLDRILAVLAGITHAEVALASLTGVTLASAAPGNTSVGDSAGSPIPAPQEHARLIRIDVPVRGILAAQLVLRVPVDEDENLARTAGKRSVDILALAMLQRMSPGLREVAGAALIRAVDSGSQPWRLQQLASAAGIPTSAPLAAVVVRSDLSQRLRSSVEQLLARAARFHASYVDNAELLAVVGLAGDAPEQNRQSLLTELMELPAIDGMLAAVGPLVAGISDAPWSLSEAKLTLELAGSPEQSRPGKRWHSPTRGRRGGIRGGTPRGPISGPRSATQLRTPAAGSGRGSRCTAQFEASRHPGSVDGLRMQHRSGGQGAACGTAVDASASAADLRAVRRRPPAHGPARGVAFGHPAGPAQLSRGPVTSGADAGGRCVRRCPGVRGRPGGW